MRGKHYLVIAMLIFAMFLSGCGINVFNLSNFILPDDSGFISCIEKLDTPQKIGDYMNINFIYKENSYTQSPYELWLDKIGDCNDFATFGIFIADCHNYETYMIRIFYSDTSIKHAIAVYVEDEGLSYTGNRRYYNDNCFYFGTFREIVDWDSDHITLLNWRKYEVHDYWDEIIEEIYK